GPQTARLRDGYEVAVQQHELRNRRRDRREGRRRADSRSAATPNLRPAAYDDRVQYRRSAAARRGSDAVSAVRGGTAARGAERRKRLDVRGGRARNDGARSRAVGHLDDRPDDPEAAVVSRDGDRSAARQRRRHPLWPRPDNRNDRRPPLSVTW